VLEFRVLGPLEVFRDGSPLALGGRRQRGLLALLLLQANEPLARERLIDEVWGAEPPASAREALTVYVFRLRRLLDDVSGRALITVPNGYMLRLEPEALDLVRFRRLARDGQRALRAGRAGEAGQRLRAALALWRGRPLADLPAGTLHPGRVEALEELRLAALMDRIDADLALGRQAGLVSELENLLVENPHRERLYAQLMTALYAHERQSEALAVYRRARSALDELGLEPGPALRRLERAILRQDPDVAPLPPPPSIPSAEEELARLAELRWFWRRDHLLEGERLLADALSRAPDAAPAVRANALYASASVSVGRGDLAKVREKVEAALALYLELGDARGAARCRLMLAIAMFGTGALEQSESLLEEAAESIEILDEPDAGANLAFHRGLLALERRQLPVARQNFVEAMRRWEQADGPGGPRDVAVCLCNLGEVALAAGDAAEAETLVQKALARFYADADHSGTVSAMVVLAACAGQQGRHQRAATLLGAAETFSEATGAGIPRTPNYDLPAAVVAAAEQAIGLLQFRRARERGRRMTIDNAVTLALHRRVAEAV
jgi:DNA-binding SARP family transcriptional activator